MIPCVQMNTSIDSFACVQEEKGKEELRTLAIACLTEAWVSSKASREHVVRSSKNFLFPEVFASENRQE